MGPAFSSCGASSLSCKSGSANRQSAHAVKVRASVVGHDMPAQARAVTFRVRESIISNREAAQERSAQPSSSNRGPAAIPRR